MRVRGQDRTNAGHEGESEETGNIDIQCEDIVTGIGAEDGEQGVNAENGGRKSE